MGKKFKNEKVSQVVEIKKSPYIITNSYYIKKINIKGTLTRSLIINENTF